MERCILILGVATVLLCFADVSAQEIRRRGTGDIVGNRAEQLRERLSDLMEKVALTTRDQPVSESEIAGILAIGKLEGNLCALATLSRNGRTQAYASVMEAITRSTTEADDSLRAWRAAGVAMADWLSIQMDLRQLETNVRSTPPGR